MAYSQVVDSSKYTVWYSVGYKQKTEVDPGYKDKEVLEIGNNYSFYYSYQRKLLNNYVDSMKRLYPSPETRLLHYDDKTPWMGNSYMILKSQHNDSLVYMEKINQGQWFRYTENFPVDGWNLSMAIQPSSRCLAIRRLSTSTGGIGQCGTPRRYQYPMVPGSSKAFRD